MITMSGEGHRNTTQVLLPETVPLSQTQTPLALFPLRWLMLTSIPPYGISHENDLSHLADIMYSYNIGSSLDGGRDGSCGSPNPLGGGRHAGDAADEALPAGADQPREASEARPVAQLVQVPQELDVLLPDLGEAQPRVEHDAPAPEAGRLGRGHEGEQLGRDLGDEAVGVGTEVVHGGGRAAHVHQAPGPPQGRHRPQHLGIHVSGRDLDDHVGAGGHGSLGNGGAVRVDANGRVRALGEAAYELDRGDDARELLV